MLRHLNHLKEHRVIGKDGEIGQVDGFFFDDAHWKLRYVKVDTRGGTLTIAWGGGDNAVSMKGPAGTVFEGTIEL